MPGRPHPGERPVRPTPRGRDRPAAPAAGAGWRPRAVLGATSAPGLPLPPPRPTAARLHGPRDVHVDARRVVVADTGHHRVLVFAGRPGTDSPDCAVVLGQPDPFTDGAQAGGGGPRGGMNLPTGVLVTGDGRLVVADAGNHRILVWDDVPGRERPADLVLGQPDPESVEPNGGADPTSAVFSWPFGIALIDGRFYVADTGNRRVLCWPEGVPTSGVAAPVVLGRRDVGSRDESAGPASFRWPHALCGDGAGAVLVADAGNHRVLGWRAHPDGDRPADFVLGQPDFTTTAEFPHAPQRGTRFRFPYGMTRLPTGEFAVADTANNRVLLWDSVPDDPETEPAAVLGQADFGSNGENRWQSATRDSLCWPYGLGGDGGLLAVADSGNNRVVLWERA